jgi:hypothetical protein
MVEFTSSVETTAVGSSGKPPVLFHTSTAVSTFHLSRPFSTTSTASTTATVWSNPRLKPGPIKQEMDWDDDIMDLLMYRQFPELSLSSVIMSAVADIVIQPDNID